MINEEKLDLLLQAMRTLLTAACLNAPLQKELGAAVQPSSRGYLHLDDLVADVVMEYTVWLIAQSRKGPAGDLCVGQLRKLATKYLATKAKEDVIPTKKRKGE